MLDKADAAAQLTEEKLPLFTPAIRKTLAKINKGPPNPSAAAVLELIKLHPDHFADLVSRRTGGHRIEGSVVWVNPESNLEFHDIDVEIVCRYLRAGFSLEDRFMQLPHARFIARYKQFLGRKQKRDLEEARRQDENRFFSFPNAYASADCWSEWSKLPFLNSDECTALALGRDPQIVSLSKVEQAVGAGNSAFLEIYRKTKRIFERCRLSKGLNEGQISFVDFQAWMRTAAIEAPAGAFARAGQQTGDRARLDAGEAKASTVHSLYKLTFALALRQYPDLVERMKLHQSPGADPKGSIFIDIEKDLRPLISKMNDSTIKKYMTLAYAYLKDQKLLSPEKNQTTGKIPEKTRSFPP